MSSNVITLVEQERKRRIAITKQAESGMITVVGPLKMIDCIIKI